MAKRCVDVEIEFLGRGGDGLGKRLRPVTG